MATFNGEYYLYEQVKSILDQLTDQDELIISDDSSTDNTIKIITSFEDPRIVLLGGQHFRNAIFNFENALKHAKGNYIFLSDQDDVWLPGRLDTALDFLQTCDLVVTDCRIVNDKLETLHESYFAKINAQPGLLRNLIFPSAYIGCCMAFRRTILAKALPFPKKVPMHDMWIAAIAETSFKVKFIYEPFILYRRHASTVSNTASKSKNTLVKKILFRIDLVKSLLLRLRN